METALSNRNATSNAKPLAMRTYYVYTLSPSGHRSYVGTVSADNEGEILRALTREFSTTDIHWSISTTPPPSPLLAHRVGSDGKLYRH